MLLINKLKEKDSDNALVKLWENKRTHALICLVLWIIFLLLVALLISFSSEDVQNNSVTNESTNDVITISDMKDKLLNYNFEYKYSILVNGEKIIYTGKYQNNENNGYKEDSLGLTKYLINSEGIYQINFDEKIEIVNLFDKINQNYLSIEYIFNIINGIEPTINEEKNELYYNLENEKIIITTNEDNIKSINIKSNNNDYLLEFYNILWGVYEKIYAIIC